MNPMARGGEVAMRGAPPQPTLRALEPNAYGVGASIVILVKGTGFTPSTVLFINGVAWPTGNVVYVSPSELQLVTGETTEPMTVAIQAAEGMTGPRSNMLSFTYTAPVPPPGVVPLLPSGPGAARRTWIRGAWQ